VHLLGYLIGTLAAPSLARNTTMARFSMLFGTIAVPLLAAGVYAVGALLAIIDGRIASRMS
jgi:phosphatidylglycerophosphate synthase